MSIRSDHWSVVNLNDLGFVGRGKSRHRPRNDERLYGGQYPFIQTANIMASDLYIREHTQTYSEFGLAQSKLWNEETLCMTIAGENTGEVAILKFKACFPDSIIGFVPDPSKADVRFIKYLLEPMKQQFKSISRGATQDNLSLDKLLSFDLRVPPLCMQQRIADILFQYDDLIENNTRRIKTLEQMAQMLYREWFVNFRFPGHEKVKMVESVMGLIPEGWEAMRMDEVAEVIDCLHTKKPEHEENGTGLLLQLFNIGENGKIDLSKKFLVNEEVYKLWTSRIEVCAGDCVITNVGRIAAVGQIPVGTNAALGRNMTGIRPKKISPTFLLEYLLSPTMADEVAKKKDAGAIMDSLNVKGIIRLSVPVPPDKLMNEFEHKVRPIRRQVEALMRKNQNLRTTRDLLLPKLVSGEVEIPNAEIVLEVATV